MRFVKEKITKTMRNRLMKGIQTLTAVFCLIAVGAAWGETKDIAVSFDVSKLTMQKKDNTILFCYDDPQAKFVEHCQGAPVLPCKMLYVVMPKNALFKGCRFQVQKENLRGTFKLYTRTKNEALQKTARSFPSKLVEFDSQKDINGYRIFIFRTYPVACQPADGSVSRILSIAMTVHYETGEGAGKYARAASPQLEQLKKIVVNPGDFEELTETRDAFYNRIDPISRRSQILAQEVFATEIGGKQESERNEYRSILNDKAEFSIFEEADTVDLIKRNFTVTEDNRVMFTPIQF